jgi:hypothetical protein
MRLLWLLGQLLIVVAWGAVLIAAVIAIWYALSFVVLLVVGRLFPLRGWKRVDEADDRTTVSGSRSSDEPSPSPPPKR